MLEIGARLSRGLLEGTKKAISIGPPDEGLSERLIQRKCEQSIRLLLIFLQSKYSCIEGGGDARDDVWQC